MFSRSSSRSNGPCSFRPSRIRRAVAGPIPETVCNCSSLARFTSTRAVGASFCQLACRPVSCCRAIDRSTAACRSTTLSPDARATITSAAAPINPQTMLPFEFLFGFCGRRDLTAPRYQETVNDLRIPDSGASLRRPRVSVQESVESHGERPVSAHHATFARLLGAC